MTLPFEYMMCDHCFQDILPEEYNSKAGMCKYCVQSEQDRWIKAKPLPKSRPKKIKREE